MIQIVALLVIAGVLLRFLYYLDERDANKRRREWRDPEMTKDQFDDMVEYNRLEYDAY